MAKKFCVWRRDDGYVDATRNFMPHGYEAADGHKTTFEPLGQFDDWQEAYDLIKKEREAHARLS